MTCYNVVAAVTSILLACALPDGTTHSSRAADMPQRACIQSHIGSTNLELRAFGAEADFWDGRASLEVHLPFDWRLETEIASQPIPALVATSAPAELATANAYRAIHHEVENADRPLAIQTVTETHRATEAEILNIRVPTNISTTYADWLLTNGILVPKLNTPGQGVDLGYNLQLQRWF